MQVNVNDIYIDSEDEYRGIESLVASLDYVYRDTSAKWMWIQEEWTSYVRQKITYKNRLRELKEKFSYTDRVTE